MKLTLNMLHRLPWKMQSHLALESEYASVYTANVEGIKVDKCVHTERIGFYGLGNSHTHYMIGNDTKVYKSHKSAVERINELLAEKGKSK